jgi:hypothetical protein
MPLTHLFVTVMNDGMGDFSHFVDIYKAIINNHHLNKIVFTPVVYVTGTDDAKLKRINNVLRSLNIPKYFLGNDTTFAEQFHKNQDLINSLKNTDQIIFISADRIYLNYKKYINPKALLKTINEHEGQVALDVPNSKKRSLGLGDKCYGIKISDVKPLSLNQSESFIKMSDPDFYKDLLHYTNSINFKELNSKNVFVPAYFNNITNGFHEFLSFIAKQYPYKQDKKDLIIYFSGCDLFEDEIGQACLRGCAKSSDIRIEVIRNKKDNEVFNPNALSVIRIFTEYYLTDLSYQAIFSCAKIAGVSGDNTLEYSVSQGVLPFYYSTNFGSKQQTFRELQKISQLEELPMSTEARLSFYTYFSPENYKSLTKGSLTSTNLLAMIDGWSQIASYLKKHKNFYNHLERIILDDLPVNFHKNEKILNINGLGFHGVFSIHTDSSEPKNEIKYSFIAQHKKI